MKPIQASGKGIRMGLLDKVKSAAAEFAGSGVEAARSLLEGVSAASGDLETLGYEIRDIEVSVTVPPSVTVYLVRHREPHDEAFAAVLARRDGQRTAWLLIKLLQQADRWSRSLKFGGRHCRELAIELGLRPGIRLLFGKPRRTETVAVVPPEEMAQGETERGLLECRETVDVPLLGQDGQAVVDSSPPREEPGVS
jgi:hypothetical protein